MYVCTLIVLYTYVRMLNIFVSNSYTYCFSAHKVRKLCVFKVIKLNVQIIPFYKLL